MIGCISTDYVIGCVSTSSVIDCVSICYVIGCCYAENAICCIDNVMTTVKGFQGRSKSIASII